jgi:hypothetical protein
MLSDRDKNLDGMRVDINYMILLDIYFMADFNCMIIIKH